MRTKSDWLKSWLGLAGLCLGLTGGTLAGAQEIGYIETFSLAADRDAALKELVPGTDEFYYIMRCRRRTRGPGRFFRMSWTAGSGNAMAR